MYCVKRERIECRLCLCRVADVHRRTNISQDTYRIPNRSSCCSTSRICFSHFFFLSWLFDGMALWLAKYSTIFHTIFLVPVRWYCIVLDVDRPFLFCRREKTKTRIYFKCFIFRPTFFLRYTYTPALPQRKQVSTFSRGIHKGRIQISDTFTSVVVQLKIDLSNFFQYLQNLPRRSYILRRVWERGTFKWMKANKIDVCFLVRLDENTPTSHPLELGCH